MLHRICGNCGATMVYSQISECYVCQLCGNSKAIKTYDDFKDTPYII